MENANNIKRSIRIPKEMHKELEKISGEKGKSVNKVILEMIKERIWG